MKKILKIIFWGILLIIVLSIIWEEKENPATQSKNITPVSKEENKVEKNDIQAIKKWNRLLWIDITENNIYNYDNAFNIGQELWMDLVSLSLNWDSLETSKGVYDDTYPNIANYYYPLKKMKIALIVSPIDTTANRVPGYLQWKKINNPEVISAFKDLMDHLLSKMDKVDIVSLSIWNEIDIYLWDNTQKWSEYTDFYNQIKAHISQKNKNLKIWTKITFSGHKNKTKFSQEINKNSDVIMMTYYPLESDFSVQNTSVIEKDFNKLISLYNKKIHILEAGYPSSILLKSSELKQSDFITKVFESWDEHNNQIDLVLFNWLNDRSSSDIKNSLKYYGSSNNKFSAYLSTLGLIDKNWKKKEAFYKLKKELELRK